MDIFQNLELIDGAELTIILLVCWEVNAAVKNSNIKNQYMSFISMAVGIVVGVLTAFIFKDTQNIGMAGLMGLLMGGFTTGLFKDVKTILDTNKEGK